MLEVYADREEEMVGSSAFIAYNRNMTSEFFHPNDENFAGGRTPLTVEAFVEQFEQLEAGKLYLLPFYPTDEQAQQLAKLKTEVSVLELSNGEVLLSKGKGKTGTAHTREELLALKLQRKAHTHPVQPVNLNGLRKLAERVGVPFESIDVESVGKMGIILPSPDDLVLGSVGARVNEIWNEYGKTTYTTYSLESEEMLGLALQMTANLFSGREFLSVLVNKELSIQEKITRMNEVLRSLGLSFAFEPWS